MGVRATFIMARPLLAFLVMTSQIALILAVEFTPNSGCASVCMDNSSQNASDPNASTIQGSDIVCADGDYQNTTVGQKFERCVNCLQNSSTSTSTENDAMWFLYNLRYAFNTCVFGTASASVPVATPCSTDTMCGPLETALQSAMDTPSISTEFLYCSANQNSFLGTYLGTCSACLRKNTETLYLANFLVALQAGCAQRPPTGVLIGLDSSVFNVNPVNITAPILDPSASNSSHKGLSTSDIIGIAIGGGIFIVLLAAYLFACIRKRMAARKNSRLKSRLDGRFGAETIGVPIHGAYIDPGLTKPAQRNSHQNFSLKRLPPTAALQMPTVIEPPRAYSPRLPEEYYAQEQAYYKQGSPSTHHEDVGREFGFKTVNSSVEPSPSYYPTGSTQASQEHSPISPDSHHSTTSSGHPAVSPADTAYLKTPTTSHSAFTSFSASTSTSRPKTSPISGAGLPRAPSRNQSIRTTASVQGQRGQHEQPRRTRDLSARHGGGEVRSQARADNQAPTISGPLVAVTTRDEEVQDLQRSREQERLRRQGYLSPAPESHEAWSSSEGEEMWPGNY